MNFIKIQLSLLFFFLISSCFTVLAEHEIRIEKAASFFGPDSETFLFHAFMGEQLIGYMSCKAWPDHEVMLQELEVDQHWLDQKIIKGFFAAILQKIPKVKRISAYCSYSCEELLSVMQDIGFVQIDDNWYELEVASRCKICEALYGKIWDQEDDSDSAWEGPFDEQPDENQEALLVDVDAEELE